MKGSPSRRACRLDLAVALTAILAAPLALADEETADQKLVISIERIWNRADHCAFTDLVAFDDSLYCAFREGSGHIPGLNGVVRIVRSSDRMNWTSVAVLDEPHVDLRVLEMRVAVA